MNDRSTGSKLSNSHSITRKLWAETFGENFNRNGAMFRGEPPGTLLQPVPPEMKTAAFGCAFQLHVKKVSIMIFYILFLIEWNWMFVFCVFKEGT